MAEYNPTPREQSLAHLREAIATGIRGRNREVIQFAIDTLEDNGRSGLTDLDYKSLPIGKTMTDPNRTGLWMRNNKKAGIWIFSYTSPLDGKSRQVEFGKYRDERCPGGMPLVEAREKWGEFQEALQDRRDPFQASDEEQSTVTIKELCEKFINDYAIGGDRNNPRKRSWKEDRRMFDYDLIACRGADEDGWGDRPVISITDDDVEDLLDVIVEDGSPRSAEKLRSSSRKMWAEAIKRNRKKGKRAVEQRWVPGLKHNPWVDVELEKRETKTAYLSEKQIRSFMRNLPKTKMDQLFRDALLLQFLTVARVGEVAGLAWEEIDFDNGIWNLPEARSKNRQAHRVILSTQAITILKRRKEQAEKQVEALAGEGGPVVARQIEDLKTYVFPSPRASGHIPPTLTARYLRDARDILKTPEGFSTHGLRHSSLTQIAVMKYPKHVRDRLSNHKDSSVDSVYQHYEYDTEAKEAWQAWADRLDAFAGDNVTVLKRKEDAS